MAERSGKVGGQALEIVVLSDNAAPLGLTCEWGFAAAVRLPSGRLWLWDTGAGPAAARNAAILGVDLTSAVGLALSHGHWDHADGLPSVLDAGFAGPVHGHPECFRERYVLENGAARFAGAPEEAKARLEGRFRPAQGAVRLDDGLTLVTDIERRPGNAEHVLNMCLDKDGGEQDRIPDDAFLVVETTLGPVAVFGCCHSGLANSLEHLRDSLGIDRLHAVVGGLHLFSADEDAARDAARLLDSFDVRRVHAGHCTGPKALRLLDELLPGRVAPMAVGARYVFPEPRPAA